MNLYEHTIVTRQDVSPSQIKQLTDKYTQIVEKNEGKVLQTQNWGLINLSYIIKNLLLFLSIGFYILLLRVQHLKANEEIIQEKQIGDGFDKFRNKDKLRSKTEQILGK